MAHKITNNKTNGERNIELKQFQPMYIVIDRTIFIFENNEVSNTIIIHHMYVGAHLMGANVHEVNNNGETELYCASWDGSDEVVCWLLKQTANHLRKDIDGYNSVTMQKSPNISQR